MRSQNQKNKKKTKNSEKNVNENNKRLRNYCHQKDIVSIDNSNITENSLEVKKLYLTL